MKNVANTGVMHWGGRLLALFENGLPYEMVRAVQRLGCVWGLCAFREGWHSALRLVLQLVRLKQQSTTALKQQSTTAFNQSAPPTPNPQTPKPPNPQTPQDPSDLSTKGETRLNNQITTKALGAHYRVVRGAGGARRWVSFAVEAGPQFKVRLGVGGMGLGLGWVWVGFGGWVWVRVCCLCGLVWVGLLGVDRAVRREGKKGEE